MADIWAWLLFFFINIGLLIIVVYQVKPFYTLQIYWNFSPCVWYFLENCCFLRFVSDILGVFMIMGFRKFPTFFFFLEISLLFLVCPGIFSFFHYDILIYFKCWFDFDSLDWHCLDPAVAIDSLFASLPRNPTEKVPVV